MSTLEATMSMLEIMPEEARVMVLQYTQKLFSSPRPANPFTPVSEKQVLSILEESRQQIAAGRGIDMDEAMKALGEKYDFILSHYHPESPFTT